MQDWYLAAFGIAVIALMVWLPGGLLSLPERLSRRRGEPANASTPLTAEGMQ